MYFKDRPALGSKVGFRNVPEPNMTIVGIVRELRHMDMRDEKFHRQVYIPSAQARNIDSRTFYLRTSSPAEVLAGPIRNILRKLDPALAMSDYRTMREQIDVSLSMERVVTVLCTAFGLIATILAGIGLYGVMAYHVARRTREIGIRMALGAQRGDVHRLVLREAFVLVFTGVGIGIPAAIGLGRFTKALLFEIEPTNVATYAGTAAFLLAIALAASLVPAWRASRIDPVTSLRH